MKFLSDVLVVLLALIASRFVVRTGHRGKNSNTK